MQILTSGSKRFYLILKIVFVFMLLVNLAFPNAMVEAQQNSHRFVREFPLPKGSSPFAIATDNSGNVWVALRNFSSIAKLDKSGSLQEFRVPSKARALEIWSIVVDSSGNLWFGDATENKIRKFDQINSKFYEYAVPTGAAQPWGLALDTKGNVWFAGFNSGKLGKLEIAMAKNGTSEGFREFKTPTNISRPSTILFDKNGLLWLMESGPARLASFDVSTERFTEYPLPRTGNFSTNPIGIALDPQGYIWYTQFRTSNIGRFDPRTGVVVQYPTGTLTGATYGIVADKEGNIWMAQQRVDRILKISTKNFSVTEFRIPTNQSFVQNLAIDPSGNAWFVETAGQKIGMVEASALPPIKTILSTTKFSVMPERQVKIPLFIETSEGGNFFPHLRASMTVTGNIANSSFVASPDLVQMNRAGRASTEITFVAENLHPGNYKMVAGFSEKNLEFFHGQYFDLTVEKGGFEFLPALVIIAAILGAAIFFVFYRTRLGAVRPAGAPRPTPPLANN